VSVRTKEWVRFEALWQVNPPPAGFGIFVTNTGPTDPQATLLRTIVHARFTAQVHTASGLQPPVDDWRRMSIRWVANHTDTPSGFVADPDSGDPDIVAIGYMKPTLYPPLPGQTTYVVDWEMKGEMDSEAQRATTLGVGNSVGVNLGFWVNDQGGWFRHVTPFNITWSAWAYLETLWLNQP
jgi:hypothetical protein